MSPSLGSALNSVVAAKPAPFKIFRTSIERLIVEKPWSDTTNTSVVSRALRSSNAKRTAARFSSVDLIAAMATGAPGAVSCSVRSGSPSHRTERAGMPSFQKTSITALVVQESFCKWADGNGPSFSVIGSSAALGKHCPVKSVTRLLSAAAVFRFPSDGMPSCADKAPTLNCRSSSRPTVFAAAMTLRAPARSTRSAIVGTAMYFPPESSSPFFTIGGSSTSTVWWGSMSGR